MAETNYPKPNIKQKTISGSISKLFSLLKPEKKEISLLYTYAIISGILSLSLPLGVQAIITFLMGAYFSSSLVVLISLVIGGTFIVGFLQIFQLTIVETLQQKIFYRASKEYAFRIPLLNRISNQTSLFDELGNRFFDTLTLQKEVPKLLMDISTALLQMLFGLILISFYHPFFAFFSLFLLILIYLFFRLSGPRGFNSSMIESEEKFNLAFMIQRAGRDHWWLKAASSFKSFLLKTDHTVTRYLEARRVHFKVLLGQYQLLVLFKTIIISILLIIGGNLVLGGQINLGQFIAAEIVILLIMTSVEKLLLSMEGIYDVLTAVEKVAVVPQKEIDLETGVEPGSHITGIEFEDLNLSYNDLLIVNDLTLSIDVGKNYHFLIANQLCRSIFMRILQGHIYPVRGEYRISGMDVHSIEKSWLRQKIRKVERVEANKHVSLLERLELEEDDFQKEKLNKILDLLGIRDELERNKLTLTDSLEPNWLFNQEISLWEQGIARTFMSDAEIIMIDLGEIPGDLQFVKILPDLQVLSSASIWVFSNGSAKIDEDFLTVEP